MRGERNALRTKVRELLKSSQMGDTKLRGVISEKEASSSKQSDGDQRTSAESSRTRASSSETISNGNTSGDAESVPLKASCSETFSMDDAHGATQTSRTQEARVLFSTEVQSHVAAPGVDPQQTPPARAVPHMEAHKDSTVHTAASGFRTRHASSWTTSTPAARTQPHFDFVGLGQDGSRGPKQVFVKLNFVGQHAVWDTQSGKSSIPAQKERRGSNSEKLALCQKRFVGELDDADESMHARGEVDDADESLHARFRVLDLEQELSALQAQDSQLRSMFGKDFDTARELSRSRLRVLDLEEEVSLLQEELSELCVALGKRRMADCTWERFVVLETSESTGMSVVSFSPEVGEDAHALEESWVESIGSDMKEPVRVRGAPFSRKRSGGKAAWEQNSGSLTTGGMHKLVGDLSPSNAFSSPETGEDARAPTDRWEQSFVTHTKGTALRGGGGSCPSGARPGSDAHSGNPPTHKSTAFVEIGPGDRDQKVPCESLTSRQPCKEIASQCGNIEETQNTSRNLSLQCDGNEFLVRGCEEEQRMDKKLSLQCEANKFLVRGCEELQKMNGELKLRCVRLACELERLERTKRELTVKFEMVACELEELQKTHKELALKDQIMTCEFEELRKTSKKLTVNCDGDQATRRSGGDNEGACVELTTRCEKLSKRVKYLEWVCSEWESTRRRVTDVVSANRDSADGINEVLGLLKKVPRVSCCEKEREEGLKGASVRVY